MNDVVLFVSIGLAFLAGLGIGMALNLSYYLNVLQLKKKLVDKENEITKNVIKYMEENQKWKKNK